MKAVPRRVPQLKLGLSTSTERQSRNLLEKFPDTPELKRHNYILGYHGGVKLEFALSEFAVSAKSRTCLDVGAATGGFTQVLKVNGASHVYAVDVGTDQLHPSLRNDPKITSMQQTDARNLKAEDFKVSPELIVCDVCFISCMKALAVPLSLAAPKAALITLVKPQFEVGRKGIGKGGLVRSHKDAIAAVDRVKNCLISKGWTIKGNAQSPIKGGSGNTEYLLHAKR